MHDVWTRSLVGGFLCRAVIMIIAVGIVLRVVVGTLCTGAFDVQSWALIISNFESGNGLYDLTGYYYAPPWGYILGAFSEVAEHLGLGFFGERVTAALPIEQYNWYFSANLPSVSFALSVKLMFFICDIAVGYLIYWIIMDRCGDQRKAVAGFGLWFLCPFVITVCASAGMFDTFSVLMTLLCIVFLMRDRCLLAGMMISVAALMKLFPAFLVFVFIAYILVKHRGDGRGPRLVLEAAVGAAVMAAVMLLPQILQGDLSECFSFLTNRVNAVEGSGYTDFTGMAVVVAYVLIGLFSIAAGYLMWRARPEDADRALLSASLIVTIVMFLYPSTPQYLVLLAPFVILQLALGERRYRNPMILFAFGTTLFSMAGNATLLLSFGEYAGITDVGAVMGWAGWFQQPGLFGLSPMSFLYYLGGVLQYAGTLYILHAYIMCRRDAMRRPDDDGTASV